MNPNWVMYCVLPVIVTDKISALLYQMAWRKARIVEQTKIALKVMSNVCSEKKLGVSHAPKQVQNLHNRSQPSWRIVHQWTSSPRLPDLLCDHIHLQYCKRNWIRIPAWDCLPQFHHPTVPRSGYWQWLLQAGLSTLTSRIHVIRSISNIVVVSSDVAVSSSLIMN